MSLSEKYRKLQSKTGKGFPSLRGAEPLAQAIATALKDEFRGTPAAIKTVAQLTRSNERAVRNWFDGKNGPSGENLILLMRHSNLVLITILGIVDRRDLVVSVGLASLRRQLVDTVAAIDGLPKSIG